MCVETYSRYNYVKWMNYGDSGILGYIIQRNKSPEDEEFSAWFVCYTHTRCSRLLNPSRCFIYKQYGIWKTRFSAGMVKLNVCAGSVYARCSLNITHPTRTVGETGANWDTGQLGQALDARCCIMATCQVIFFVGGQPGANWDNSGGAN